MLRRVIGRRLYSLKFEDEALEFANRKALIKGNPSWYYPPLSTLRSERIKPLRIPQFRQKFETFAWPDTKRIDEEHSLEGRIHSIRKSGKGMVFIDLFQDSCKVQLVLMNKLLGCSKEEFSKYVEQFKKGDHIAATGFPGVTNVGELSLKLTKLVQMASPIMHPIPPKLTDPEKRHHNKVVDYLVNERSRDLIIARSRIMRLVRDFFETHGFIEVETPNIASNSNGANATPFVTHSRHIKQADEPVPLQLRVAPELWLKRLIIGGFDKVFEVSKVFRNEGIDSTHNPEFTTVEFYQTFTTLEELMHITEDLFAFVSDGMSEMPIAQERSRELLSTKTFKRLEFIPEVELASGHQFPAISEQSLLDYLSLCGIKPPRIKSIPHLLDKLSSTYLEPQCIEPTFIFGQPSAMSPLSKSVSVIYGDRRFDISKRFELFIHSKEFVNAYEEENSPFEQSAKFALQQDPHDEETPIPDLKYVEAMEWGLPPTGGWGMGVDRLCMYLCQEQRIEEVLTFGTLPDVVKQ